MNTNSGELSGIVQSTDLVKALTIDGSVLGTLSRSLISVRLNRVNTINIGGDVIGAGILVTDDVSRFTVRGNIYAANIGQGRLETESVVWIRSAQTFLVQGSVVGSRITADGSIWDLQVNGSLTNAIITAVGTFRQRGASQSFYAFRFITVNGHVENSSIIGGTSFFGLNPDAQIGRVVVNGNWHHSQLIAGAAIGTETGIRKASISDFTSGGRVHLMPDSASLRAKIDSINIGGDILGRGWVMRNGFFAEEVGSFTHRGARSSLNAGQGNDKRFVDRGAILFEYRDEVW